jgi:hypothetical protein
MQKLIEDVKRLLEEADPSIKVVEASDLSASHQEDLSSASEPSYSEEASGIDGQSPSDGVSSKFPTTD